MSGDQNPLLAGVIPIFEVFITGWETLKIKRPHLGHFINPGLDSAGKYYSRTDLTLSECVRSSHPVRVFPLIENFSVVNPSIRMTWIMNNWEKEWSDKAVGIIQGLVNIVWFHEIIYY